MIQYQRILLATDLTCYGEALAYKAVDIAENSGARLTLLHVVEAPSMLSKPEHQKRLKFLLQRAQQALWQLGKALVVPKFDQVLTVGMVGSKVLEFAQDAYADLIIIGRNSELDHIEPMGSTAYTVANQARCDVLTVSIVH